MLHVYHLAGTAGEEMFQKLFANRFRNESRGGGEVKKYRKGEECRKAGKIN